MLELQRFPCDEFFRVNMSGGGVPCRLHGASDGCCALWALWSGHIIHYRRERLLAYTLAFVWSLPLLHAAYWELLLRLSFTLNAAYLIYWLPAKKQAP